MTARSLLAALALTAALAWGFAAMVPASPGVWTLLLAAATFGVGPAYASATDRAVDVPWRRLTRTRALARRLGARRLAAEAQHAGWTRRSREPIRSRADVRALRRAAVGTLLSHLVSLLLHVGGAAALAAAGHPGWAVVALVLAAPLHVWPALVQVEVLARVDELRALVARRG